MSRLRLALTQNLVYQLSMLLVDGGIVLVGAGHARKNLKDDDVL